MGGHKKNQNPENPENPEKENWTAKYQLTFKGNWLPSDWEIFMRDLAEISRRNLKEVEIETKKTNVIKISSIEKNPIKNSEVKICGAKEMSL